jgi:hypothetical protein
MLGRDKLTLVAVVVFAACEPTQATVARGPADVSARPAEGPASGRWLNTKRTRPDLPNAEQELYEAQIEASGLRVGPMPSVVGSTTPACDSSNYGGAYRPDTELAGALSVLLDDSIRRGDWAEVGKLAARLQQIAAERKAEQAVQIGQRW